MYVFVVGFVANAERISVEKHRSQVENSPHNNDSANQESDCHPSDCQHCHSGYFLFVSLRINLEVSQIATGIPEYLVSIPVHSMTDLFRPPIALIVS